MGFNLSGFGTFAGGMAKGIESGVGLVAQHEEIERKRRRRDAAGALGEVGTFEEYRDNNTTAIPMDLQAAPEGAAPLPGANPLAPPPQGAAIPDVMSAGGQKRPDWAAYRAAKMKAYAPFAEDDPELFMRAEQDLENTRRHMLMNAVMQARGMSDEDATRTLNDAYETFVTEGSRPGNVSVATDPETGEKKVLMGGQSIPFDQLGMLMTDPETYAKWMQDETKISQQQELIDLKDTEVANARRAQEDEATYRMEALGIQRVQAETQRDYYAGRLAAVSAERGEAHAKAVSDGFKSVSQAESDYRTDLTERDPEFAQKFGHTIGVVADALVEADPSKSGRQYLNNAEWMVRTRDPESFKRMMETDPGIAKRWTAQLADGTSVPAYEIRPDGGADIKVFTAPIVDDSGETVGQYDFIIDPITGSKQRLTPELRSVFDRLEDGNLGPPPANPANPEDDTETTALPEPRGVGEHVAQTIRDVGSAAAQWGGVLMDLNNKYGTGPWVRYNEDFANRLLGLPPAEREEFIIRNLPGVGQEQVEEMVGAVGSAIPPDRIQHQRGR